MLRAEYLQHDFHGYGRAEDGGVSVAVGDYPEQHYTFYRQESMRFSGWGTVQRSSSLNRFDVYSLKET